MSKPLSIDRSAKYLVIAILILLPLVSIAGGLAIALLTFILGLVGLSLHIQSSGLKIIRSFPFLMLMLFLLWACITSIWSPYHAESALTNYTKLFIMGAVFYFSPLAFKHFSQADALRVSRVFLMAMMLGALVVVIDILTNFKITLSVPPPQTPKDLGHKLKDAEMNLSHAISILVLLSAPVTILLKNQFRNWKTLSVLFFSAIVVAAFLNDLWIGVIGAGAVAMTMVLAFKVHRQVPVVILSFTVLAILLAPLLAFISSQLMTADLENIPLSWEHRLRMWGYCWSVIAENPILGDGFDAARSYTEKWTTREGYDLPIVSLHTHNAGIQIWTETGLIGALLASTFLLALLAPIKTYAKTPDRSAILSGVMVAGLLISSTTSGAWQSWWWGCLFLSGSIIYLLPDERLRK